MKSKRMKALEGAAHSYIEAPKVLNYKSFCIGLRFEHIV
jgi:hypothetical protein